MSVCPEVEAFMLWLHLTERSFRDCESPCTSSSGSLTRKYEIVLVADERCDAGQLARGSDCGGDDDVCGRQKSHGDGVRWQAAAVVVGDVTSAEVGCCVVDGSRTGDGDGWDGACRSVVSGTSDLSTVSKMLNGGRSSSGRAATVVRRARIKLISIAPWCPRIQRRTTY